MTRLTLSAVIAGLISLTGCSTFDLRKEIPWGKGADGELEQPMKVVCVWSDTIMSHANEVPRRGFGGRLMFYANEEKKPVKVKGTLTVYAFDETNRDPRNVKPDRKYIFTEEEFEKHHSESKLGDSYSVWLPWDKVGGPQTEVSLVVRFMPSKGSMVVAPQHTVLLHGASVESLAAKAANKNAAMGVAGAPQLAAAPVQQTSYSTPGPGELPTTVSSEKPRKQMTSMTISVTPGPGNRLPTTTQSPMPSTQTDGANSSLSPQPPQSGQTQPLSSQSSARFGPDRLRPLGAPIAQLSRDRGPWQPTHAARPSAAASTPQSVQSP